AARGRRLAYRLSLAGRSHTRTDADVEPAAVLLHNDWSFAAVRLAARSLYRPAAAVMVDAAVDADLGQHAPRRHYRPGTARRRDRLGMAQSLAPAQSAARSRGLSSPHPCRGPWLAGDADLSRSGRAA